MGAKNKKKPRVFLGLLELAGYYSGLRQGLSELGVDCVHFALDRDVIDRYISDQKRDWVFNIADDFAMMQRLRFGSRIISFLVHRILTPLVKLMVFSWAVMRHDVFVFGFATTFFNLRELPLLKLLRKKVIFVFHGSDSRPAFISGHFVHQFDGSTVNACIEHARIQKQNIQVIERYAYACINNPPGGHFHERPFVNHNYIGHPIYFEVPTTPPVEKDIEPRPYRILHAPSRPIQKGTPEIRAAISLLRGKGHEIELREITKRPNEEVLAAFQWCDLVVDQVYSDIPFACFASEAAFAGKPVLVGSYAQAEFVQVAEKIGMPTTLFIRPEELEKMIERLIVDRDFRDKCAVEASEFIRRYWSPAAVAGRFLSIINGETPAEWWFDPKNLRYLHGWGAPEAKVASYVRKFVDRGGISALQLSDKPELERAFLKFAYERS